MNQGTQNFLRFEDDGGTINTQIVDLRQGTVTLSNPTGTTVQFNNGTVDLLKAGTITTLPNIPGGTITRVSTLGTLEVGTISSLPNTPGGTLGLVTRVGNVGTLEVGTISALPNTPGGTLGLVTTVSNLTNGSVRVTLGTTVAGTLNLLDTVTTVSNLTNGSVRMTVGTLTVMPNIPGGTVGLVTSVTEVVNLAGGTVTRLAQGSINVTAGTVNAGTINAGTVQLNPYPNVNIIAAGTTSAGTIGTLVAAPAAGTQVVVTGFHILQISGTAENVLSFGLQAAGNQVLARGNFPVGGGMTESKTFPSAYGATGTALTWNQLSGAGTVSYKVEYYLR